MPHEMRPMSSNTKSRNDDGAGAANWTAGQTAAALLAWYETVGVDAIVAEAGTDWFAKSGEPPGAEIRRTLAELSPAAASEAGHRVRPDTANLDRGAPPPGATWPGATPHMPASKAPSRHQGKSPSPAAPSDASQTEARRSAAAAPDLAALAAAIAGFDGCTLKATATKTCVYRGAPAARIAVIGEAPGRDEDLAGLPFVGRAGQLLDKMLAAIGLDETNTHITNIVYWRPPGNRAPTPQEALVCRPFLDRQIALVDPDIVLLMGGSAAKHLLETNEGIMRSRGKWKTIPLGGRDRHALATLHPAYLLRTPAAKHMAWKDLRSVKKRLEG